MSNWISVEDRLPLNPDNLPESGYQTIEIIVTSSGFVYVDEYSIGDKPRFWGQFGRGTSVTHWMPLPEPAEGEAS